MSESCFGYSSYIEPNLQVWLNVWVKLDKTGNTLPSVDATLSGGRKNRFILSLSFHNDVTQFYS